MFVTTIMETRSFSKLLLRIFVSSRNCSRHGEMSWDSFLMMALLDWFIAVSMRSRVLFGFLGA